MTPTAVTEDLNQHYHTDKNRAGTINKVTASLVSVKVTLSAQMDHTFVQYYRPGIELFFISVRDTILDYCLDDRFSCECLDRCGKAHSVREIEKVRASFGMQQSSRVQMTHREEELKSADEICLSLYAEKRRRSTGTDQKTKCSFQCSGLVVVLQEQKQ